MKCLNGAVVLVGLGKAEIAAKTIENARRLFGVI